MLWYMISPVALGSGEYGSPPITGPRRSWILGSTLGHWEGGEENHPRNADVVETLSWW